MRRCVRNLVLSRLLRLRLRTWHVEDADRKALMRGPGSDSRRIPESEEQPAAGRHMHHHRNHDGG